MDRTKYQYEGMKWIVELELLNNPQAINNIKLNILMISNRIREVELLIYRENKSMLVLLDLTWMGRKFFRKQITSEVQEVLNQLLPSFRFRITEDPKIMEMAVNMVKTALTGGKNENTSNLSNDLSKQQSQSNIPTADASVNPSDAGNQSSSSPSEEEQSKLIKSLPIGASSDDSKEKQKA